MCEAVMPREDIPKQLKANGAQCYLGFEESDDEDLDALTESYDIQMGDYIYLFIYYKLLIIVLVTSWAFVNFRYEFWSQTKIKYRSEA